MKKLLPLLASVLLLTACGNNPSTSSGTSNTSIEPPSVTSEVSHVLTFLNDGEIYIDFNFQNAPEGLAIKVGETTLSASGKATMSQNFTFEVSGTFANSLNIYYCIDANGSVGGGKSNGVDAEIVKDRIDRYLTNFSSRQYEYRVYFCLSDQENGWSKTLEGVDGAMRSFAGQSN